MKKQNYKAALLLFLICVPVYAYLGSPASPLQETLTLVSKYSSSQSKLFYAASYLGILVITSASVLVLAFSKSKIAFITFIVLALFHSFDISYTEITGNQFNVSDYIFLVKEISNAFLALDEYRFIILQSVAVVVIFIAIIAFLRRFFSFKVPLGLYWLPLAIAYAAVIFSLHASDGKRANYVSPIRLPGIVMYSHLFPAESGLNIPYAPRILDAAITPEHAPLARHILFIVDESVTGQYLSINGYALETTPYLKTIQDKYINLGCITSVGNLSMNSNYILRNGILPDQLPDHQHKTLAAPSLFNFAQRAGMRTALLDCQQQVSALQNYLSNYDLESIDIYEYFPATKTRYGNDFIAIEKIKQIQSENESSFIMVVKYGAHFPYQDRYPADKTPFQPDLLSTGETGNSRDASAQRIMITNTYLNALRWNVDDFFAALLPQLDPDTVIIYTSDHGQSINDEKMRANHGVAGTPPAAQVSVPLLLFPKEKFAGLFSHGVAKSGYSQFQTFPTLLKMMGYSDDVTAQYGQTFWQGAMPQQTFTGALFLTSGKLSHVQAEDAKIALPDGNYATRHNLNVDLHPK